ncbi:MAG: hypothetical protein M0T70_06830 [Geobacteraceae bacterium]|nr:hypothetical protein [Geobacteraceae bacterium]
MKIFRVTGPLKTRWGAVIGSLIVGTFLSCADARGEARNDQSQGHCFFSERLKNPAVKAAYLERLAYPERGASPEPNDVETMYRDIEKADYSPGQSEQLDQISRECVTCHDGSSAPTTGYSHPVGMDYDKSTSFNRRSPFKRNYVTRGALNPDVVLIDGKVGCLSCHNPLNPAENHLAMSNENSSLCFSCHIK